MRKALIETVARLSEFLSIDPRESGGEEFRRRVEAALSQARQALAAPTGPKRVDGYLSRKAQQAFPDAIVYSIPSGELDDPRPFWILETSGGTETSLGREFGEARLAIAAIRRGTAARKPAPPVDRVYYDPDTESEP